MRLLSRRRSVRTYLLAWIISPIALFIVIDSFSLYRNTLESVNTAYDRMLIASVHSIGDLLRIENGELKASLPYAALEIYEADYSSRMIYRINDLDGKLFDGDDDLPAYSGKADRSAIYPSLAHIYEDTYNGAPVRVAALFQPVATNGPRGTALVQVAETMENRSALARKIFWETLVRQMALLVVIVSVTLYVVSRALQPVDALRRQLDERSADDLSPVAPPMSPRELQPFINALNQLMARLRRLLDHQQRFVANASHQLRTPLAVLKTQLQSGLRGDAPAQEILAEMSGTVDRATNLANQLLSLAKVEQLRGRGVQEVCDLGMLARETAVDLSPLIAEKNLDFELEGGKAFVMGHPWMVSELISNLLHNAIRHTPAGGRLGIRIRQENQRIELLVWDSGGGIAPEAMDTVFKAFSSSGSSSGGLGLTICGEIVDSMGATINLHNRFEGGHATCVGLNASVVFPIVPHS
ncbi:MULTISPECIES: sensor histidine kinase [unclassified Herbaspirillum]|uniref:sensor histidine kinase n=1 Tax=unclassified Herbaspirillum TaxID=2624150 RepID=UPI0011526ADB|nr:MULTISPECIES: sensor histidine kinase N-terminal domain-containing protein [unclassified Herbaspirillum]MBB5389856.1 two-component system sensor histidine kinase TctE [Herbaspirillum sp. SJZ102]TQK09631.1 two-component system sensor histidine kinase TctE [Herbaspirillum sp. SJZ130]TQK13682.1 two-component system sensor histidine kinase TctE [Herbaspirillum sp. SJZ106]